MPNLVAKTILAMDARWQGKDSFISMGPAKKINESSLFRDVIQTPYVDPSFEVIVQRIERYPFSMNMKTLNITKFSELLTYETL